MKKIRSWGGELLRQLPRNLKYIRTYYDYYKNSNKKSDIINVVFLVQRTEVWNSVDTVFREMLKNLRFCVSIIALPPWKDGNLDLESNDVMEFCLGLGGGNVYSAYDKTTRAFKDIRELSPHYIFLNTPYTYCYPPSYSMELLAKVGKICLIPYGYEVVNSVILKIEFDEILLQYVSLLFAEANVTYEFCKRKVAMSEWFTQKRVYKLGYPRFDFYHGIPKKSNGIENILWIPRWTSKKQIEIGNEPSSFFLLKDNILDYASMNCETNITIRPHPKAFDNYVKNGDMTEEDVELYKKRIQELANVELDQKKSYEDALLEADVMIADYSGIIAEYFILDRPIIYMGSFSNVAKDNDEMFRSFYKANTWEEVVDIINDLKSGIDIKKEQRKKAVSMFLEKYPNCAGERITNAILKDYEA